MQRFGELVALIEAVLFGLGAILHAGVELQIGGMPLAEPMILPAVVIEGVIALGLLLAVLLPGRGAVRAGRVLAAQVLAVIGVLVGQVALAYGLGSRTLSNDLMHVAMLALSFASMFMVAWPRAPVRATPGTRA
jgi:hypothetical protein